MDLWSLLRCPQCRAAVRRASARARCTACSKTWPLLDGEIPYFAQDRADQDAALGAEIAAQRHACGTYVDVRTLSFHWDLQRMQEEAALLAIDRGVVLDVGCGPGFLSRFMPGVEVIGVDVSPELLRTARSSCEHLVGAPAEQLPFADSSVDGVFGRSVLHHTIEARTALAEMHRVLRPGGRALFSDPRAFAALERFKSWIRRHSPKYAPTHKAFARDEYAAMIASAGFEIEAVFDTDPLVLPWIVLADEIGIGRLLGAAKSTRMLLAAEAAVSPMLRRLPHLQHFGFMIAASACKPLR